MYKGMRIDTECYLKKFSECEKLKEQLERCLNIIVDRKLNPRSYQQVSKYLYEDLNLPEPITVTESGKDFTTSAISGFVVGKEFNEAA